MFENIQLAFQGVFGHKLRSFLTMLGIIIGIASIITIISTIKGTNEQIKQNLIGSGSNIVNVQLYQNDWAVDMSYQTPDGIRVLQDEQRDEMIALDGVADVTLYRSRENVEGFYYRNTGFSGKLYGVDDHYFSVYGYEVRSGRGFTARDFASASKNVILDETAAKTLFSSDDPIGKIVEISGEPFTVVGVVSQKSSFEPRINSVKDYAMYVQESSGLAFVPTSVWPVLYRFDEPQNVAVRATSTDTMTDAGKAVADYLTSHQIIASKATGDNSYSYRSDDLLKQAQQLQEMSSATNNQLIWIASISLLVGGVGVMNIMLVTVTERTAEIGLKKAIGAKRRRILAQFLTEASVLTGIGGLLALGVGDTIRVSLTDDPVKEVYAAKAILRAVGRAEEGINVVSCPTCGRTRIDLIGIAKEVERRCAEIHGRKLKVAVMGCVVNGPGEAREADLGIAGGDGEGLIFRRGEILRKVPQERLVDELMDEIAHFEGE